MKLKVYVLATVLVLFLGSLASYAYWSSVPNYNEKVVLLTGDVVKVEYINNGENGVLAASQGAAEVEVNIEEFQKLAQGNKIFVGYDRDHAGIYAITMENGILIKTNLNSAVKDYIRQHKLKLAEWEIDTTNNQVIVTITKGDFTGFLTCQLVIVGSLWFMILAFFAMASEKRKASYY